MIDPSISLGVHPVSVTSPLDAFTKQISIADMLSQIADRKAQAADRAATLPLRQATAAAAQRDLEEANTMNQANDAAVNYDAATGTLKHDDAKALAVFAQKNMMHLAPKWKEQSGAAIQAQTDQILKEADSHEKLLEAAATPAATFKALPDLASKKEAYGELRTALIRLNPANGKLLPYDYDPVAVDPKIDSLINQYQQTQTFKTKLIASEKAKADAAKTAAETHKYEAEAGKLDQEAGAPKSSDYAPGTLIITRSPDGKEISRETVPEKPPTPPAAVGEYNFYKQQESQAGRTPLSFDEWQNRDANRKTPKPTVAAPTLHTVVDDNGNLQAFSYNAQTGETKKVTLPEGVGATGKDPQLTAQIKQQAFSAELAKEQLGNIRTILKAKPYLIGPVVGRLTDFAQGIGEVPYTDPKDEADAATLNGHLTYLFGQELRTMFGGRTNEQMQEMLQKVSGNIKQGATTLDGFLKATENNANNVIKVATRHGYKSSTAPLPDPAGIRDLLPKK